MSLDVYLEIPGESLPPGSGIFIREDGQTKEISREEWNQRFPDREPVAVIRDGDTNCVYRGNITHNLNTMAEEAGIYQHLWRPEEIDITKSGQLIGPLRDGLGLLQSEPDRFKVFNPPNGWGNYEGLVRFVADYLAACERFPDANVRTWR